MYHHASRIAYLVTVWQTPKKISKKNTYYVMLPLSHMLRPSRPENPEKVPALLAVWDLTLLLFCPHWMKSNWVRTRDNQRGSELAAFQPFVSARQRRCRPVKVFSPRS